MGSTRIEQAVDEIEPLGDELDPSCDDIRPAWLTHELSSAGATGAYFDAIWTIAERRDSSTCPERVVPPHRVRM